jgi:hypothetical protein
LNKGAFLPDEYQFLSVTSGVVQLKLLETDLVSFAVLFFVHEQQIKIEQSK